MGTLPTLLSSINVLAIRANRPDVCNGSAHRAGLEIWNSWASATVISLTLTSGGSFRIAVLNASKSWTAQI